MKHETLTAEAEVRLDAFVARSFPAFSRQFWKERIAEGGITVDGLKRPPDYRLREGERVDVRWDKAEGADLEPFVIHEDKHVLVLNKPSGLIVHPLGTSWIKSPQALEKEPGSLVAWLWRARLHNRPLTRLGLVHRLDQGTSGVMVIAKTDQAYESLVDQFRDRLVEKRYRALVAGHMEGKLLAVHKSVGRRGHERKVKIDPGGRQAMTEVHILKTSAKGSLVEARPKTGRTHQIRVHLASLGHPVLGDREWMSAADIERLGAARLMLHAFRLTFKHPGSDKRVNYEAKPPKDFSACWKALAA